MAAGEKVSVRLVARRVAGPGAAIEDAFHAPIFVRKSERPRQRALVLLAAVPRPHAFERQRFGAKRHWRGGAESIRQNQLFKDFYLLAESKSKKRKYLYVLGTEYPLHFLNGGRKLNSVLSRNVKLLNDLQTRHGDRFKKVREYYLANRHLVRIEDVSDWVLELVSESAEIDEEEGA